MEKGQRSLRRIAKIGAFVASLVLALSLPDIAFAANTATFSGQTPKQGSSSTVSKPIVSIIVYDTYGVSGSSNYSMTINGQAKKVQISYFGGYGYRKFKLSYQVQSAMAVGLQKVVVRVKDLRSRISSYAWNFTVLGGTVLDLTPPVTTSDAALNYTGPATIHLFASDNVAVANTYCRLDGGVQTTYAGGITVPVPALALTQVHTLEFWSVDARGNTESHHMVFFSVTKTIAMSHVLPDLYCSTTPGCHGGDLASIHVVQKPGYPTPPGCVACHSTDPSVTPSNNCQAASCHGANGQHTANHIAIQSSSVPTACTASGCHDTGAMVIHTLGCVECHGSTNPIVVAAIAAGEAIPSPTYATCETCHSAVLGTIHARGDAFHAVVAPESCVTAVCHAFSSVVDIHATQLTGGPAPQGCASCHAPGKPLPATVTCVQAGCHPTGLAVHTHPVVAVAHVTTNTCASGNSASCHPSNVATIHTTRPTGSTATIPGCVACHGVGITPSTNCAAAGCHPTPPASHTGVAAHQLVASGCWNPDCHSSDASLIHGGGVKTPRPGCADCHNGGVSASTTCLTCHPDLNTANDPHNPIFSVFTDNGHATVLACSGCHARATGLQSCTDCHGTPTLASLGAVTVVATSTVTDFSVGQTVTRSGGTTYTPTDVLAEFNLDNASRHNVLGSSVGMKSSFDGSDPAQGPAITDSSGNVITQEWPIPTACVFWSQRNSTTGTQTAPATARTDVGPDSVITCQDCHTGSDLAGALGPHGSTAEWLIDPNYPDDWTTAELTSFDPTGMRSQATSFATNTNPYYPMPANESKGTAAAPSYSAGDIPGRYICQKCHKLVNPGQGIGYNNFTTAGGNRTGRDQPGFGFSNEAHMEHHPDQVTGQSNCTACHIAIPHGWKRPRLLVYSTDVAPYRAPVGANFLSRYPDPTGLKTYYLDAINAAPTASKDLTITAGARVTTMGALPGEPLPAGAWDSSTGGVGWNPDPNTLRSPGIQNNCNACTATGTTHKTGSEGVPTSTPTWN